MNPKRFLELFDFEGDRDSEIVLELRKASIPLYIYGAGDLGEACLDFLRKCGIEPTGFFVDKKYLSSDSYSDIPCVSHEALQTEYSHSNPINVVIGISDYALASNRFSNYEFTKGVFCIANPYYFNTKQLTAEYFKANASEFKESYELFADDTSRNIFVAYVNSQINRDAKYLFPFGFKQFSNTSHLDAYFNNDVISLTENESYIDCGAYHGEDVLRFLNYTNEKFTSIIAIEPDPKNYAFLRTNISSAQNKNIYALNLGVGDRPGQLCFSSTGSQHSHFVDHKVGKHNKKIDVDTIDNIMAKYESGEGVTLIKLNIRAFEYKALIGARNTIARYQPRVICYLGIANDSLSRLPKLLMELNPNYQLFLRCDYSYFMRVFLYAVERK